MNETMYPKTIYLNDEHETGSISEYEQSTVNRVNSSINIHERNRKYVPTFEKLTSFVVRYL